MTPFLMWMAFSGGLGWSVHKQKWGLAAFFAAMLAWVAIIEISIALMAGAASHGAGSIASF